MKALAELPFLVLADCGITCAETVGQSLKDKYLGSSRWMEYYLLHNWDITLQMDPICLNHYACNAKVYKDLYGFAQEIHSYSRKKEICRWAKNFSPGQIWFCCLIEFCFKDLQSKGIIPGGRFAGKYEIIHNTADFVKLAQNPGSFEVVLNEGDSPIEKISPYSALMVTAARISTQNILYVRNDRKPSGYLKYLRALRADANYARTPGMQQQHLSVDGEKLEFIRPGRRKHTRKLEGKGFVK